MFITGYSKKVISHCTRQQTKDEHWFYRSLDLRMHCMVFKMSVITRIYGNRKVIFDFPHTARLLCTFVFTSEPTFDLLSRLYHWMVVLQVPSGLSVYWYHAVSYSHNLGDLYICQILGLNYFHTSDELVSCFKGKINSLVTLIKKELPRVSRWPTVTVHAKETIRISCHQKPHPLNIRQA